MQENAVSFTLDDAEEVCREFPETFKLPPLLECGNLKEGDFVKLIFRISHGEEVDVERMWVKVEAKHEENYVGTLANDAYCTNQIESGLKVQFEVRHIIHISYAS